MKKLLSVILLFIASVSISNAQGQASTTSVSINIQEVSMISSTGSLTFNLNSMDTSGNLEDVTLNTLYSVSTNGSNKKVTAALDDSLPIGVSLNVEMQAPVGSSSTGAQQISMLPVDLVTGISKQKGTSLNITWIASADISVDPQSIFRVVTLTFTSN